MKQTAQNTFADGLNLDLHPIVTPNSVLTDNLNGTFITYNGNEFCLQNDRGNTIKATLTEDFVPIGIKEHNGILYIVSHNPKTGEGEIGTYPGAPRLNVGSNPHDLLDEYLPLQNGYLSESGIVTWNLRTSYFNFDLEHPVTIEIQDSYDGSVNLILIDNKNEPRLVNSGFSALPGNKYITIYKENEERNYYILDDTFNSSIRLVKTSTALTKFDLISVDSGGELKGGNYTFYLKYGDLDGNKTDIICQSGTVSVTKSSEFGEIGTLYNEISNKKIEFEISNIDTDYKCFYLEYFREFSDTQGYSMSEAFSIEKPFYINDTTQLITITGTESETEISQEELNIAYHTIDSARASSIKADMLFLGNVSMRQEKLQDLSLGIKAKFMVDDDCYLQPKDYINPSPIYYKVGYWYDEIYRFGIVYVLSDGSRTNVFNICGSDSGDSSDCDPNEFVETDGFYKDDSTNITYNKFGVFYSACSNASKILKTYNKPIYIKFEIPTEISDQLIEKGVIGYFFVRQKRNPITLCQSISIPIEENIGIPMIPNYDMYHYPLKYIDAHSGRACRPAWGDGMQGITESFLVQKSYWAGVNVPFDVYPGRAGNPGRIATLGIDYTVVWKDWDSIYYETNNGGYVGAGGKPIDVESFKKMCRNRGWPAFYQDEGNDWVKSNIVGFMDQHIMRTKELLTADLYHGLLCADAMLIPEIRTTLSGEFDCLQVGYLRSGFQYPQPSMVPSNTYGGDSCFYAGDIVDIYNEVNNTEINFVDSGSSKYIDSRFYTTTVGNKADVRSYAYNFLSSDFRNSDNDVNKDTLKYRVNVALIRGNFTPFLVSKKTNSYTDSAYGECPVICNIKRNITDIDTEIHIKAQDSSPFYCISDLYNINSNQVNAYRGDCYPCNVTLRYIWNFGGSTGPVNTLVKARWDVSYEKEYEVQYKDWGTHDNNTWLDANLDDVNNTPLGLWLNYNCFSNYNLNIRSIDESDPVSTALYGMPRAFQDKVDQFVTNEWNQEESRLMNAGYSKSASGIRYTPPMILPYTKTEYSNRIIFSNKQVNDAFVNGFRTFQGAAFKDFDKQYGEIVKLLPLKESLFCVMSHGLSLIPVNERALLQTTTDQTIHIYGHGVLPDNMTIVSQDYGSKYEESVVQTPIGIYGIDSSAKKIWRFSETKGFETLSDMKIETFLNHNLDSEYLVEIQNCDIRTHYNAFKGDIIFTWYNNIDDELKLYSICYNERQGKWTTRYDWVPLVSENVNGAFFSLQEGEDSDSKIGIYSHEVSESSPTKWYGKQHPFEYEFVVSDPIGVHKIYENLQIISNNVQPEELQFEFIGDSYMFNKARIYHTVFHEPTFTENRYFKNEVKDTKYETDPTKDDTKYSKPQIETSEKLGYQPFRNGSMLNDRGTPIYGEVIKTPNATEQYHLRIPQECRNIETWGRRLGNIHYKKDSWFTTIEPIVYDANLNDPNSTLSNDNRKWSSARIRDKWCKIRVRYFGDDLAVITAIKTIVNV